MPVREQLRRHPMQHIEFIDEQIDRMLAADVIEPANGQWASNICIVRKPKTNELRFAIDYRRLNAMTTKSAYPIPRIDTCLDSLDGAQWFSTIDLRSGYWQVKQSDQDADKTSFVSRKGCFRFKRLSFGLCGAPSLFQRLIDLVFSGLTWTSVLCYLDDVVIYSQTIEEHLQRLSQVLERLQKANLKIKPSKCQFMKRQIQFLGYVVSNDGIATDPDKIRRIA